MQQIILNNDEVPVQLKLACLHFAGLVKAVGSPFLTSISYENEHFFIAVSNLAWPETANVAQQLSELMRRVGNNENPCDVLEEWQRHGPAGKEVACKDGVTTKEVEAEAMGDAFNAAIKVIFEKAAQFDYGGAGLMVESENGERAPVVLAGVLGGDGLESSLKRLIDRHNEVKALRRAKRGDC